MSDSLPIVEAGDESALRAALEQLQGRAFILLGEKMEGDWSDKIMEEYRKAGKEFLFSSNGCEGAVFGPHAHYLIPAEPKIPVTDWIRKYLRPLVAETGLFAEMAAAARAVREERESKMAGNVFFHTGDLGDIIAALPTIRALGGGYLILGNRHGRGGRELMSQARFDIIEPLLSAQSYLTGVERIDDAPAVIASRPVELLRAHLVTHDFTRFRETAPPQERGEGSKLAHGGAGYNLATWQAKHFKIADLDLSPWLTVPESDNGIRNEARGKAIFARTERYHNPKFDWGRIVKENSPALFVGLEDEWKNFSVEFCGTVGAEVRYRPTGNFLELAQLIAASRIVVANQSCPCWIAMAMGHPLIQESDQWNLNSVVERHNAEYRM
jgi:hypothetical protein